MCGWAAVPLGLILLIACHHASTSADGRLPSRDWTLAEYGSNFPRYEIVGIHPVAVAGATPTQTFDLSEIPTATYFIGLRCRPPNAHPTSKDEAGILVMMTASWDDTKSQTVSGSLASQWIHRDDGSTITYWDKDMPEVALRNDRHLRVVVSSAGTSSGSPLSLELILWGGGKELP
jgi:hypothetical protein